MCPTGPLPTVTVRRIWAYLLLQPILIAALVSKSTGQMKKLRSGAGLDLLTQQLIPNNPILSREELCRNFTGGSTLSRFISTPFYPSFYAANVECIRVVTAPSSQHLISLDFRNFQFEIETDAHGQCTYDYVEVRNGPYGFSPLIGRFCGEKSPGIITADSGVMWIYFRSDPTLQYSGFQAVLNFILMPTPSLAASKISDTLTECKFRLQGEDGTVNSQYIREVALKMGNDTNRTEIECVWRIEAAPMYQLRFLFRTYELAFPNECAMNFMEIYQGITAKSHRIRKFCGLTANKVDVISNVAFIRTFVTLKAAWKTNFDIFYTVFVTLKNCSTEENFYCGDDTCVPRSLVCNQRSNCITDRDEQNCVEKETKIQFSTGPYLIFLVVIVCLILGIVTCAAVINLSPRFRKKPLPPSQQSARTFEESGQSSPTLNHLNANFSLNSPPSQLPQPIANGQLPKEMSDFSRLNGKQVRQQGCTAVAEDTEVLQIHRRPYSTPIQQNGGVKRLPQLDLDDTASTTVSAPNGRIGRKSDPLTNRKLQGRQKALSTQLETIPVVDTQPILLNRIANGRRRTPFAQQNHRDKRGNSATRPFVIQPDLHCPSEDTLRNLSLEQLNRVNSVDSLSEAEFFVVAI